jgi:hypothetical protein
LPASSHAEKKFYLDKKESRFHQQSFPFALRVMPKPGWPDEFVAQLNFVKSNTLSACTAEK